MKEEELENYWDIYSIMDDQTYKQLICILVERNKGNVKQIIVSYN